MQQIVGLEISDKKTKTEEEVLREFERDKWGRLIEMLSKIETYDLKYVENLYSALSDKQLFYLNHEFFLTTTKRVINEHVDLYSKMFSKYLGKISCIVEFGAGFGSKILSLATRKEFKDIPIYAAELTDSGQDLIRMISKMMNLDVNVGGVDFRTSELTDLSIPKNALIFTSYALHYDPKPSRKMFKIFHELDPYVVINYEPCYELYGKETVHGQMCMKYINMNDYTRNIYGIIKSNCSAMSLSFDVYPNIIGENPFMPISCLEWGL